VAAVEGRRGGDLTLAEGKRGSGERGGEREGQRRPGERDEGETLSPSPNCPGAVADSGGRRPGGHGNADTGAGVVEDDDCSAGRAVSVTVANWAKCTDKCTVPYPFINFC
jgi:hypothetical protein